MPRTRQRPAWASSLVPSVVVLAALLGGCARKAPSEGGEAIGQAAKPGSSLAYEHVVQITLPTELIAVRLAELRADCESERVGPCRVLAVESHRDPSPRGRLQVRASAAAVDSLIAAASPDGHVDSVRTTAEDLAEAVSSTERERETLTRSREGLLAVQSRGDLAAADLIAIVRTLAEIDTQLAAAEREAATQRSRIETNLLTLQLTGHIETSRLAALGAAVADSFGTFLDGTAEAIDFLAFSLPFLVIGFVLLVLLRRAWNAASRRHTTPP